VRTRPALKLLFISGYADDTAIRHGVLAKDDAFPQKPFTPDAIARRQLEVLDAKKGGGET
jgi:two-component system cell cycle sensor histidine kinase/response regulator CckA